jgi:hypothetical protein
MFEVIISRLKTGRVERKQFGTREEAEQYLARTEEKLLQPRRGQRQWVPSLRDYRLEIVYREPAQVAPLPGARSAAA